MGAGSSELPAYAVATQEGEGTASSFVEPAGRGAALRQSRVTSNREQLALAHAHCARAGKDKNDGLFCGGRTAPRWKFPMREQ